MNTRQRRRWLALLILLTAAGGGLLWLCSRFRGFGWAYALPLLLAGICAASGTVLAACWLWARR